MALYSNRLLPDAHLFSILGAAAFVAFIRDGVFNPRLAHDVHKVLDFLGIPRTNK